MIITSQPTEFSVSADRIVNIISHVEDPSANEEIECFNEAYVKNWHKHEKGLARITGKISEISRIGILVNAVSIWQPVYMLQAPPLAWVVEHRYRSVSPSLGFLRNLIYKPPSVELVIRRHL